MTFACSIESCPRWAGGVCTADGSTPADGRIDDQKIRPSQRSLAPPPLEVIRLLADTKRQVFRAQGTCMYPDIRPGDILEIQSRSAPQVAVGEIAVCRRPFYLFGHRVIEKGVRDGKAYILTRPDRALSGDDGPTYDEDLLGVVTAISRGGRRISPEKRTYSRSVRTFLSLRLRLIEFRIKKRAGILLRLNRVQKTGLYAAIARPLLIAVRGRPSFAIRIPLKTGHDGLYQSVPLETFDPQPGPGPGRSRDRWILAVNFGKNRRAAAWARFELCPVESSPPHWRLADMSVRSRYRGAGIEKVLLLRAKPFFDRQGMGLHIPES